MKTNGLGLPTLVLLALSGALGCSATPNTPAPAAAPGAAPGNSPAPGVAAAAGPRIDFPSYGISVPVPPGYVRDTDSMNSVVIFVPAGRSGASPGRTVMIDLNPGGASGLRQHVDATAETEG